MAISGRGRMLAAVAGAAAAGAAFLYLREKKGWTPAFTIEAADGAFEIRRYPALTVVEAVRPGRRDRALGDGFAALAGYVLGSGSGRQRLPTTLPVMAAPVDGGWRVRVPLPEDRIADLPVPGEGVTIATLSARRIAALRFTGRVDDRLLRDQEMALRGRLIDRGEGPAGGVEHALYYSPMLPGRLRQNEVWLPC
ncbi:MAG: heme-binding protein [Sphingomonas fennica]